MDRGLMLRRFGSDSIDTWVFGVSCVVVAALVFAASLTPVSDADLWWHLAAGREMVTSHRFLRTDPFTLSAEGRPWIDLHWLFQLFVYGMHQLGGLRAVVIAKATVVAGASMVLLAVVRQGLAASPSVEAGPDAVVARRLAPPLFVLTLGTAIYVARHLVLLRPVILTLLFLSLFLLVLERNDRLRHETGRLWAGLWWLPVMQVVWVNCQGLFALGPAMIGSYVLGRALEARSLRAAMPLGVALGASLAVCFVTPYGLHGVLLPIKLLLRVTPGADNVFSSSIAENIPPWVLERTAPGQFWHLSWALIIVAASFVVGRHHLRFARVLVVMGFAALGQMANRNVLLFYWVAAPIAVMNFAPSLANVWLRARDRWMSARPVAVGVAVLAFGPALLALTLSVGRASAAETTIAQPSPFRVPTSSTSTLAALPVASDRPGRIFAADHYGGYIAWMLYPRHRAFIDTRLVLHTGDEYADFLGLLDHPERFDEFARRQSFDHALLPTVYPDRYLGLIQHLLESPEWQLAYTDGTEVLFARVENGVARDRSGTTPRVSLGDQATVDQISAHLEARLPTGQTAGRAAQRHLARLLLVAGHADRARDVLTASTERHPDDADARLLLARTLVLSGDLSGGEAMARALLDRAGEWPPALDLLAQVAVARGDATAALGWLRRSLAADPNGGEALRLLAALEAAAGTPGTAP